MRAGATLLPEKSGAGKGSATGVRQLCSHVLTEDEWRLLVFLEGTVVKNNEGPALQWAYQALVKLGEFTDSKRTGIAGWDTLWKSLAKLQERVNGFQTAREMMAAGIES